MKKTVVRVGMVFLCAAAFAEDLPYRTLPMLQSTPETVRPLPLGFTSRAVLPWFGTDEPPVLLVMGHGKYFEHQNLMFRAAAKDGRGEMFSLPSDYPVYDGGRPLTELEPARYISIPRSDGLFDLVRPGNWTYYINSGTVGAPTFAKSYPLEFDGTPRDGDVWVEDVTGDGVPDALIGGLTHPGQKFAMYPDYPNQKGPWGGVPHPNMATLPDTDIQNFRGYDIAGNWMGQPVRKYLWWAKGGRDAAGKLSFGKCREVLLGTTDYPVQWQCYDNTMSPVVMDLESGPHILLFSGNDQAYALPVRGEDGPELRVGKPQPLLKDGAPMLSVNRPGVVGKGDLNGDGQMDLVIGSGANGRFTVLTGTAPGNFKDLGNIFCTGGPLTGDTLALPVRTDWNQDGFPDVLIGGGSGELSLWNGTADPLVYDQCRFFKTPAGFIRHRPVDGNLQGDNETAWSYLQPEVGDWDGDGNPDLITNDNEAKLFFYRGTGSGVMLEERQRFMMDGRPLPVAWRTRPAVIDGRHGVAGDDRPCLLFMKWENTFAIAVPQTRGSLNIERIIDLVDEDGLPITVSGPAGFSGRAKFSVADWDGDGVWDIVMGTQKSLQQFFRTPERESPTSAPFWLRNVGTNRKPVFQLPRMITFKDATPICVNKHNFNVWPTDLNGSGTPDLLFGDDEGFMFYLFRDQLAWNESIEPDRKMKKIRAAAARTDAVYEAGESVFAENWEYAAGTDPGKLDGGSGWAGGWQVAAEQFELQFAGSLPGSPADNRAVAISGDGRRTAAISRMLAKPVNFNPEVETVFVFSLACSRSDKVDNGGTEVITLFELRTADGEPLCSVELSSKEALGITLGGKTVSTADGRVDINGSYVLNGRLILRPEGESDELFAALNAVGQPHEPGVYELHVVAEADGAAAEFQQRVMKFAGWAAFDSVQMTAE